MQRNDANRFHFVMLKDSDSCGEFLPDTITLSDVYPMEPPFMRKRRNPVALRIRKFNEKSDPKKYFFSECILYSPFRTEEEIWEKVHGDISKLEHDIRLVKNQVSTLQ